MTRSSNVIDLDGLSVTLKGTFEQEAGKLVGGLGEVHRYACVRIAVDAGEDVLNGGILVKLAQGLAVDDKLLQAGF